MASQSWPNCRDDLREIRDYLASQGGRQRNPQPVASFSKTLRGWASIEIRGYRTALRPSRRTLRLLLNRSERTKPDLVSWRRLERARGDRPDAAHSSCYGRGRNNAKHCGRRPMFCRKTAAILYPRSDKAFDCRAVPAGYIYVFTSGGDGRRPFLARLRQLKPGEAVLSVITYGELAGSFTLSIIPPRAHNGLLYWC